MGQEIVDLYMSLRFMVAPFVTGAAEATAAGERMAVTLKTATQEVTVGTDRMAAASTAAAEAIVVDSNRLVSANAKVAASIGATSKEWQSSYRAMAATTTELSMQMTMAEQKAAASAETMAAKIDAAAASTTATSAGRAEKLKQIAMGTVLVAAVVTAASVKMAGDFEQSTNKLVTSAGETEHGIGEVRTGMLNMASEVGVSALHLSDAMYKVESAGYHGAAGLGVLKAAEQGAKAEGAEGVEVADALSSALRDYYPHAASAAEVTKASADVMSKFIGATSAGKMTFNDLAGALNSILPVASAAKVSLSDVLGVLASMTVHGISAQQAAQNIADAIRHLQAPTMVMSKAMATLGIDSVDVASKLGERGLSGTMQLLSDRVKKAMPPGSDKVILNLGDALSKSTPKVQELGERLLAGTITMAGFGKEAKALDPLSAKQAQSFSTLAGSYHQLGTQQISGAEVMQTYGGMMQKLMGDATGLKVALMTTGENAEYTNDAIKTITGSTADAQGNVKGWAEVQNTFNQKMAEAKDGLGAMAIKIGTVFLPVASRVAGVVADITGWFSHNESAAKTLAIVLGTVLAAALGAGAIGMIKWITSLSGMTAAVGGATLKLGLLAAGFQIGLTHMDSFAGVATLVVTSITAVGTAVSMLSGPMGAVGGLVGGVKGHLSSFGTAFGAAEGVIGKFKVAAGGVMSFLTGPWGIALGLAVGAIALFSGGSKEASAAVDDLTKAIQDDSGELGKNARAWTANKLEKDGALNAAKGLGIEEKNLTDSLMSQGPALDAIKAKLEAVIKAGHTEGGHDPSGQQLSDEWSADALAAQKLLDEINGVSGSLNASRDAAVRQSSALHESAGELHNTAMAAINAEGSGKDLALTSQKAADALSAEKNEAKLLTDQLDLLNGGNIDATKSAIHYKDSIDSTVKSLKENGKNIDINTEKGRKNVSTILDAVGAAQDHAKAVATQTHSVEKGNQAFQADINALQGVLREAGLNDAQMNDLAKQFWNFPPDINRSVNVDTSGARSAVAQLSSQLNSLPGGPGRGSVHMKAAGGLIGHFAGGGFAHFDWGGHVQGAGTESSDGNLAALSDNEYVQRARAVRTFGVPFMDVVNSGDVNTAYRMLAVRPDVNRGHDGGALAVSTGGGGGGTTVINKYVVEAGMVVTERGLQDLIQEVVLRYGQRNNGTGLSAGWNT